MELHAGCIYVQEREGEREEEEKGGKKTGQIGGGEREEEEEKKKKKMELQGVYTCKRGREREEEEEKGGRNVWECEWEWGINKNLEKFE
jgi:hypothetical protein